METALWATLRQRGKADEAPYISFDEKRGKLAERVAISGRAVLHEPDDSTA